MLDYNFIFYTQRTRYVTVGQTNRVVLENISHFILLRNTVGIALQKTRGLWLNNIYRTKYFNSSKPRHAEVQRNSCVNYTVEQS